MIRTFAFAAAALLVTSTAAFAGTYSIQITGVCDHLTLTVNSGVIIGSSDVSGCDASAVVGATKGKALTAAGDLGYGPVDAWIWNIKLGKHGAATAILTGNSGGSQVGPVSFDATYTTSAQVQPPSRGNLPAASSLLRK